MMKDLYEAYLRGRVTFDELEEAARRVIQDYESRKVTATQ